MNARAWAAAFVIAAFGAGLFPAGATGTSQFGPPGCWPGDTVVELGESIQAASCSDPDGLSVRMEVEVLEAPGNGDIQVFNESHPIITFTGRRVGTGTLRIKATNAEGESSEEVTVELTVRPVTNDPPECGFSFKDFGPGSWWHQLPVGRSLNLSCYDEERDPVTYTVTRPPALGQVYVTGGPPGNWGYSYVGRSEGRDTFDMAISDGVNEPVRGTVVTYNTPGVPLPPLSRQRSTGMATPTLVRGTSKRRLTVQADGALPLTDLVSCRGAGPACQVFAVARISSKRRSTRIASRTFRVRPNDVGLLKLRLSRRALRLLRQRRTMDTAITVEIQRGSKATKSKLRKTLRAPATRRRR